MENESRVFLPEEEKEFKRFYRWSERLIRWRPLLRWLGWGMFIALDALLLFLTAFVYVDFFLVDYFDERAMVGSIAHGMGEMHAVSATHAALPLQASEVTIFEIDNARSDFMALVSNPNDDWYARFHYQFIYGETATAEREGFLLPGEENKPIVELAVATESAVRSARLSVVDLQWIRLNHHAIRDYPEWQDDRLEFAYENVNFEREVPIDTTTVGRSTFMATNRSAFGYWDPLFTVVLLRNEKPVGVTQVHIDAFEPGTSRQIMINWFGPVIQANETRIVANIDIFDPDVYMPIRGEAQPDVRERIRIKRR